MANGIGGRAHWAARSTMRVSALLGLFLLVVAAGCGENAFQDPTGFGGSDRGRPDVQIVTPDSALRVAVGDSVLVEVRVTDDAGIAAVELSGFAIRGSVVLGTDERVPRYESKIVDLTGTQKAVRDTTLVRYLVPTPDAAVEDTVFLAARVADAAGNVATDSVRIRIGGPRIHILSPQSGSSVRAGTTVKVRISANDPEHRFHGVWLFASGAVDFEDDLHFEPPRTDLDTIMELPIPTSATSGQVTLHAGVRNTVNDTTASAFVVLDLLPPLQDTNPPTVRFRANAAARAERTDSLDVTVVGFDDTRIDRVGVTIIPIHRRAGGTDTLTVTSVEESSDSATFRFTFDQLGVPMPTDTSTLRLEVTAFAVDTAGHCSTATVPNTALSEPCATNQPPTGARAGARFETTIVRGRTIRLPSAEDRIADLVADGSNVFLSNIGRNQLEVIPIGGTEFTNSIPVGSKPWGLAFNRNRSRLYVANSGGTNISVVSPSQQRETDRISTPNVKLYDVAFNAKMIPVFDPEDPEAPPDSVSAYFPTSVVRYDYSDRPQYLGVTANENIVYSTVPSRVVPDGTVRVYRTDQERLEFVTAYAENKVASKVVIVNADSVFMVISDPDNLIEVCPRDRSEDPAKDRQLGEQCFVGSIESVGAAISDLGYDTKFLYSLDINEIGLADTTFVAVSGDHSTIAVGEGARQNGRVISLSEGPGAGNAPFVRHGEVGDLVGNTAERLSGLALNSDGSLGLARGSEAFFFSKELRLEGVVTTEPGGGAVDMHLDNPAISRSFVSGVTADGLAYIDVMDTFHFRSLARIFLRDPVTGPIRVVRTPQGGVKIYAVTAGGVASVDVLPGDL